MILFAGLLVPDMAHGITIKYDIDNAANINFRINDNLYDIVDGINSFEVQAYVKVEITAKRNCSIVSVTADLDDIEPIRENRWFHIVYKREDNVVFKVTTANLDEERTEKFHITLNGDPEMVSATLTGTNTPIFLREGRQTISYSQKLEPVLTVSSLSDRNPLYRVTVDGRELDGDWSYEVPLTDGCEVVVDQSLPQGEVTLTITYGENARGCVDTFTLNNQDSRELTDDKITCKSGDNLIIYFKDTFKVTGVSVNGMDQTLSTEYTYFYYTVKGDATIHIEARPYGDTMFVVNIDNAEAVKLYRGYINPDYEISLTDGRNEVGVPELDPRLIIKAATGHYIISINGDSESDYTQPVEIAISAGMELTFVTGDIVRDNRAVVFIDDAALAEYYLDIQNVFDEEREYATKGYTLIDFDVRENPFEVAWAGSTMAGVLYLNDVKQTSPYAMHTYPLDLAHGDVVKIFPGAEPASHAVEFEVEDGCGAVITRDVIVGMTDFTAPLHCLEGTMIEIEGDDLDIAVDGQTVKPEGRAEKTVLTVDRDMKVSVKSHAGISDIDADTIPADVPVYNLQGIRVHDLDNAHAGIYIRGGRKITVRK